MAYAATITYNGASTAPPVKVGSFIEVAIAETEGAAASEATLQFSRPMFGVVRQFTLRKSAGTGATFAPVWGNVTDPAAAGTLSTARTAAASPHNDATEVPIVTDASGQVFYRSVPNAGSDNTTAVRLLVRVDGFR